VVITSIEFDHADIYENLDAIKLAFKKLVSLVPTDGIIVAAHGDKNIDDVLVGAKAKVLRYGVGAGDYQIVEREMLSGRNHFAVKYNGKKLAEIAVKAPGEYNAMNAIAVFALAREMGWDLNGILQGLANFKGVMRRQQVLSTKGGITVIEDFAHHPTAVEKTISAVREQYLSHSKGKLIALFEPRSATSRRKIFQEAYVQAFQNADRILIATPYDQSKISEADRFSSADLIAELQKLGRDAKEFSDVDQMAAEVKKNAQSGDVVLVMSNGAFGGIYKKLI
jgi:UDP-N-acetylmuramate: L-alanyl-gamma-D-glutamyl-meso-diaminopimelate ligase